MSCNYLWALVFCFVSLLFACENQYKEIELYGRNKPASGTNPILIEHNSLLHSFVIDSDSLKKLNTPPNNEGDILSLKRDKPYALYLIPNIYYWYLRYRDIVFYLPGSVLLLYFCVESYNSFRYPAILISMPSLIFWHKSLLKEQKDLRHDKLKGVDTSLCWYRVH